MVIMSNIFDNRFLDSIRKNVIQASLMSQIPTLRKNDDFTNHMTKV